MDRRTFLEQTCLSLGTLAFFRQKAFSGLPFIQDNPWKMRMLRNDVGIFTEKGGTIAYLLSKKGTVVVDAEFPEQAGHLLGELKKLSTSPLELLINTHHHLDHTAGNIAFKGIVQSVAAHSNSLANQKRVAIAQKNEDQQLYPDLTFTDTWKYKIGKEHIRAYYFGPAHTNGDSLIHFEHANIVHMGDLIFNRQWAYIDRSAGASIKNWISVLDHALETFDSETQFVFGHALVPDQVTGNKEDLKAMQDYLAKLLDFVNGQIRLGRSKDDVMKEKSIPGVTQWGGNGIEHCLQAAYEELTVPAT